MRRTANRTILTTISIIILIVAILASLFTVSIPVSGRSSTSSILQSLLRRFSVSSRTTTSTSIKRNIHTSVISSSIPSISASGSILKDNRASKMSDLPYAKERRIAELAVQRAAILTQRVYESKVKGTVTKDDKSPVTGMLPFFFFFSLCCQSPYRSNYRPVSAHLPLLVSLYYLSKLHKHPNI